MQVYWKINTVYINSSIYIYACKRFIPSLPNVVFGSHTFPAKRKRRCVKLRLWLCWVSKQGWICRFFSGWCTVDLTLRIQICPKISRFPPIILWPGDGIGSESILRFSGGFWILRVSHIPKSNWIRFNKASRILVKPASSLTNLKRFLWPSTANKHVQLPMSAHDQHCWYRFRMSICKKRPQRKGIAKLEHVVFWHWIRLSYKVYICLNQFKSYFSWFSDFSQIWSYNSHLLVLLYEVFLLEPITSRGDNNHPGFGLRINIPC